MSSNCGAPHQPIYLSTYLPTTFPFKVPCYTTYPPTTLPFSFERNSHHTKDLGTYTIKDTFEPLIFFLISFWFLLSLSLYLIFSFQLPTYLPQKPTYPITFPFPLPWRHFTSLPTYLPTYLSLPQSGTFPGHLPTYPSYLPTYVSILKALAGALAQWQRERTHKQSSRRSRETRTSRERIRDREIERVRRRESEKRGKRNQRRRESEKRQVGNGVGGEKNVLLICK